MTSEPIREFKDENFFLSNFWPLEGGRTVLGCPTTEHAFQMVKTLNIEEQKMIRDAATPGKAKRLGKKVTLREDWNEIKLVVMRTVLIGKFRKGTPEADMLEATGDRELIEGNDWGDTFWGVCNGVGQNELGKLLMWVRAFNREEIPEFLQRT